MLRAPLFPVRARFVTPLLWAVFAATAPARSDPVVDASAASNGPALQALLDRDPGKRDAIVRRAVELGLAVLEVPVGDKSGVAPHAYVAGGGKAFQDCATDCPPMVVLPPSQPGFEIGSPPGEAGRGDDEALTKVTIKAFAIGGRPVTVAEYKACVADGGCDPPEWLEAGGQHNIETGASRYYRNLGEAVTGPDRAIVGVSHIDATAYAKWLSGRTGHAYRLPSEAEWEFAARAGTKTAFWWGDEPPSAAGPKRAACLGCGTEWDGKSPAPPAAFPANPWGLFNVHGSVWEWTADYYCDDYASGPKDGSPRLVDDCAPVGDRPPARGVRSLRGGSSFYEAKTMRSAMRVRNVPQFRNFSVGFRVARDVTP